MHIHEHLNLWFALTRKYKTPTKIYNARRHIFTFPLIFFLSCSGWAMKKPSFILTKEWEKPLISLLDEAVRLQKAFQAQSDMGLSLSSAKMVQQIRKLELSPEFLPYHQHFYIQNLLKNLLPDLEALGALSFKGSSSCFHRPKIRGRRHGQLFALEEKLGNSDCKGNIKSISRALTYVAQAYGLNNYAVLFCPADRSVYLQKAKTHHYVSHSSNAPCIQIKQH